MINKSNEQTFQADIIKQMIAHGVKHGYSSKNRAVVRDCFEKRYRLLIQTKRG